jgi:hypothetical protein
LGFNTDLLILRKDADGSVDAVEIDDLDELDDLRIAENPAGGCSPRRTWLLSPRHGTRHQRRFSVVGKPVGRLAAKWPRLVLSVRLTVSNETLVAGLRGEG